MKTIRFLRREGYYTNVVNSMANPIIQHLPSDSYIIQDVTYDKKLNKWSNTYNPNYFDVSMFVESISYQHDFFISHGIADKYWRNANRMNPFNYVGVSGNLWVDKLVQQGMDKNKIKIIGYPKLDDLFDQRKLYQRDSNIIKVLYVPTHNMNPDNVNAVSSYPRLMPFLDNIPDDIQLVISCHPANNNQKVTYDELLHCDVVISDSGSLLYEAWALDIPVVFPDWIVKDNIKRAFPSTFEDYMYDKKIGYHADNREQLISCIRKAFESGMDKQTINFIEGIFPRDFRGKSGKLTADILMELVNK